MGLAKRELEEHEAKWHLELPLKQGFSNRASITTTRSLKVVQILKKPTNLATLNGVKANYLAFLKVVAK